MGNKNEWKELEEWYNKKNEDERLRYGLNISNMDVSSNRKLVNKIVMICHSFNLSTIIIFCILIIIIIGILITYYENFSFKASNYEVEKYILQKYNIDVTIFSKVKEPKKNYITFKLITNDSENIEFTVIKKNNKIMDDYINKRHKYYFDLWNCLEKDTFKVNEKEENELLINYETYIDDFENIEEAIDLINEFALYYDKINMSDWEIYVKENNKKIYPLKNDK